MHFHCTPCFCGQEKVVAESRGRVVNTPALYSLKSRVQISARRTTILTEVVLGFPQSIQANPGIVSQH
jgi:hypothetical protein